MAKKLGRGLSNLIPGGDEVASGVTIASNPDYIELNIDNIYPNPDQPRKHFSQREIEELAETLHSVGLIEPIVVRPHDNRYQIISGERRWRACKHAGFKKIPAVIKRVSDVEAIEMGIIENIQREELTPIEEARAYEHWISLTGNKPSDLATRIGKDRSTITNLIRLLKLPESVLELLNTGRLSAGQARPLLGIGDARALNAIVKKIVDEGWSARRVEEEVGKLLDGVSSSAPESRRDPNITSLENTLRSRFTAKVEIQHKKNGGGKISIGYGNLDDLERIIELLGVKK